MLARLSMYNLTSHDDQTIIIEIAIVSSPQPHILIPILTNISMSHSTQDITTITTQLQTIDELLISLSNIDQAIVTRGNLLHHQAII